MPATAASLTESRLPRERAVSERCEKEVFSASSRFITICMNCEWERRELVESVGKVWMFVCVCKRRGNREALVN